MDPVTNLVIFWQEELWGADHFLKGKFDVFRLKPFKPEELAEYYIKKFEGPDPFTRKALIIIAELSRGIFRWFKKYIRICLDRQKFMISKSMGEELRRLQKMKIDVEQVKEWVTLGQLLEDWNRELIAIFPRSRGNRKKAVIVLRFLREKGPTDQSTNDKTFFGGNKMACSRLLNRLEAYDYVKSEYKGRTKVWSIV